MLEKRFKLKENNTSVRTEIIAGLTTFMTMAYIIALNPNLLTGYGAGGQALWNGVFLATCISSAVAMFVMAFLANKPFCLAPGMGLNSFMAIVIGNLVAMTGMGYVESFQAMLCIILIEGIVFFILSLLNIREKIVDAIPLGIRLGISPAIGLMLLKNLLDSQTCVEILFDIKFMQTVSILLTNKWNDPIIKELLNYCLDYLEKNYKSMK